MLITDIIMGYKDSNYSFPWWHRNTYSNDNNGGTHSNEDNGGTYHNEDNGGKHEHEIRLAINCIQLPKWSSMTN